MNRKGLKILNDRSMTHAKYLFLLTVSLVGSQFIATQANAQETPKFGVELTKTIQLNSEKLKPLEGFFQNPKNKDMYVQITVAASGNGIMCKRLWNNNQMNFLPETELNFVSAIAPEDRPLRLLFKKDSTGAVSQLSLGNNDLWTRVTDYKPIVKVEMRHTPEQLKPLEGTYSLQNNQQQRFIQFTVKQNQLVLKQHWDGTEQALLPETELSFFIKDQTLFSLVFSKDANGVISQALVNKRDNWTKIVPVHLTNEQLKVFEGKYQFKDDPDNLLQLSAKGQQLVVKQIWDGKEISLTPQTDTYFYNNEESYSLLFNKDADGNFTQLRLLGIDIFTKVK